MFAPTGTPPMGWNSFDCFGTSVTEDEVRANAEFIARHLRPYGWEYLVVDIEWYEPTARAGGYNSAAALCLDEYGRPIPAENRFPSASGGQGFGPLADFVHGLGLKFGVHIMRGIPRQAVRERTPILGTGHTAADVADRDATCTWLDDNYGLHHAHPAAQSYYDSLLALFASWGIDYVKADDMIAPYRADEVAAFSRAVRRCDREMVLSLSPGTNLSTGHAEHLAEHAHLWRISNDLWDRWADIEAQFDRLAAWAPYAGPNGWPDADMLPLGHIGIRAEVGADRAGRLTPAEQVTMMTLWCIARSPLMVGADLPTTDRRVIELMTNPEVLAANRHDAGARQIHRDGGIIVWASLDRRYLAVFHTGDERAEIALQWSRLGWPRPAGLRDVWRREDAVAGDELRVDLDAHGAAMFEVSA